MLALGMWPAPVATESSPSATENQKSKIKHPTVRYFGDYELVAEIARGGMGVVYRARQVSLSRFVALKMIAAGQLATPAAMQRFHTEAEAAARLDHPHIVPIYEIGQYEGQHYYSMKLIEGGTLAGLNADCRVRDAHWQQRAAALLCTVARAVHYAHQRGILHRDLKPRNILLDEAGEPHITDFGLAKLLEVDASITHSVALLGTPAYMAPEQAAGGAKQLTTAADIYSLGAILYELLTGQPPFIGEMSVEVLRQVCEREPAPPRALNPQLDRDLETICLKCLSKDPQRRYASAELLAQDLDHWCNGEPILARPPGAAEKARRWCRGHPASAALLLVLLIGLASAPVVVRWQSRQAAKNAAAAVVKKVESYITEAHSIRTNALIGRRFESLAAISNAARLNPSPVQREALRNEASACFALTDLRVVKRWTATYRDAGAEKTASMALDKHRQLYARTVASGAISICQVADDHEIARLPAVGSEVVRIVGWSADSSFVTIQYQEMNGICRIWDIGGKKPVTLGPGWFDLRPDSRSVAIADTNGWLTLHELPTMRETLRIPMRGYKGFRFLADGARIARGPQELDRVEIADLVTGKTLQTFVAPEQLTAMNPSTDGRLIAGGSRGGHIYLWDTETGERTDIDAHQWAVNYVEFNHANTMLASGAISGEFRLWDVATGQLLISGLCNGFQFCGDEGYFFSGDARHAWLAEPSPHPALRLLGRARRDLRSWPAPAFNPDGRLLATMGTNSIQLWDAASGKKLAVVPEQGEPLFQTGGIFQPDGSGLIISSPRGLYRWPIERVQGATNGIRFGPRTPLLAEGKYGPAFDITRDGRFLVTLNSNGTAALVFDLANPASPITLGSDSNLLDSVALSPDGRLVAIGAEQASRVQVWDVAGHRVKELPMPPSTSVTVAFSADGRWLAASGGTTPVYRLYRTGSWDLRLELTGSQDQLAEPGLGAFSPDGEIWAIGNPPYNTHLYSTATGRRFAILEPPHQAQIASLAFSPDGATLAVLQRDSVVQLWDMRYLRQELAALNLDWDLPPYPPALR
jgi:WD40 repeat protein